MRQNIAPLTSFRFFAAALVVIFHYPAKAALFPFGIANFGYEAVTFFFMLSGFVLTYAHLGSRGLNVSTREFFYARIVRIAPAYLLALAVAAPFFISKGNLIAAPFVVSATQAWIPDYALAWNAPAWSLSNEMFFYACYPAIVWAIVRTNNTLLVAASVLLVLVAALWREVYFVAPEWHDLRFYFPPANLPQFLLGTALGVIFVRGFRARRAMLWVGLLTLAATITFVGSHLWLSNTAILSVIFGLIVLGATSYPALLGARLPTVLGNASYALYIIHVPFWLWWDRIFRVILKIDIPAPLDFLLYAASVVAMSVLITRYFERPIRLRVPNYVTSSAKASHASLNSNS